MASKAGPLLPITYGLLLKRIRESRGLTRKGFADALGFSLSHIGGVESLLLLPTYRLTETIIENMQLSSEQADELIRAEEEMRHTAAVQKTIKYICRQCGIDHNEDNCNFLGILLKSIKKMTAEDMSKIVELLSKY